MGDLVRLDYYQPVWRTAAACCAKCRCVWEAVLHVEVKLAQIKCPRCRVAGNVTLTGLSAPGPMPDYVRRHADDIITETLEPADPLRSTRKLRRDKPPDAS